MVAFVQGDAGAFAQLARRHQQGLISFCARMLGGPGPAEDATQEILLRAVRSADHWTPQATVRTWIFTIARNYCIDQRRKAQGRETESLEHPFITKEGMTTSWAKTMVDEGNLSPDRVAASVQMRDRIVDAIDSLPDEQREVFMLRECVGLPFRDIGEIVGASENTTKSRMRYALRGLQASLKRKGVSRADVDP